MCLRSRHSRHSHTLCHPERARRALRCFWRSVVRVEGPSVPAQIGTITLITTIFLVASVVPSRHHSVLPARPPFSGYVYILQSVSRRVLYIGITSDLHHRVSQHKNDLIDGFTKQYRCHRLVYFEEFPYIKAAIAREKQLKGWTRAKKEALITKKNPHWVDLAADWKHAWAPDTPNGIKLQP